MDIRIEIDKNNLITNGFVIYDKNYNELASGIIYFEYIPDNDSYMIDSIEVIDNFIFENDSKVNSIITKNLELDDLESTDKLIKIELTETEKSKLQNLIN